MEIVVASDFARGPGGLETLTGMPTTTHQYAIN